MTHSSFDAGSVRIALAWRDGRACDVSVRVARPTAANLLRGRAADEAIRLLPMLYAICGEAQGAAASLALAAARGEAQEMRVAPAVLAEARREHLWRLLLDWPEVLGLPRQEALFVAARKRLQDGSFDGWFAEGALREHFGQIEAALGELPMVEIDDPLLPSLSAEETVGLWPRLDETFASAPTCRGRAASTGALARHAELASMGAVAGRVMARIVDLADPAGLGSASSVTVAEGIGRAAVETARGLLLHEIVLDGERVADYTIVAPTEWNFHVDGALRSLLESTRTASAAELEVLAKRAVLAFDPCVRFEIAVAGS